MPPPPPFDLSLSKRAQREVASSGSSQLWASIIALCKQPGVIDLGQGAPDFVSDVARRAANDQISNDWRANQYSPIPGAPLLNQAIASYYQRTHQETLDPALHIAVTCSATEGLFAACAALLDPGDEVLVFEPLFPWYLPCVRLAGGVPRVLRLAPPLFALPLDEIRATLEEDARSRGNKIKMMIFNSPHNPTGAVIPRETLVQLESIIAATHPNCIVLADEAYEAQVFAPSHHVRMSTVLNPERVLTLGTASKMFSLTGWRVGWMTSRNAPLLAACKSIHAYTSFCAPTPLQLGIAAALEHDTDAMHGHGAMTSTRMKQNAELMCATLEQQGLVPYMPQGGYFVVCDISATGMSDAHFCEQLATVVKVGSIPLSVFYANQQDPPRHLIRIAICKTPETIREACDRIAAINLRGPEFNTPS